MCDNEDRCAHLVDLLKQQHQFKAAHRVEVSRRLIGDDHARVVHQRTRDGHTLLLTAGEFIGEALFPAFQSDKLQNVGDPFGDALALCPDNAHGKGHIVVHGHVLNQAVVLENHAKRTAHPGELSALDLDHVKIIDNNLTGGGTHFAGDQFHQGRLPRAGRSDKKDKFPFVDRQIDPVERNRAAAVVDLRDVCHLYHKLPPRNSVPPGSG